MPTLFTRIIQGEIPCHKIAEDNRCFAFLDIHPIAPGHTLVVPKLETDQFFDLPADLLSEVLLFSQPIASAIREVTGCRIGMLVAGLEVPHAHLHLVPITSTGQLTFANAKPAEQDALAAMAKKIRACLK